MNIVLWDLNIQDLMITWFAVFNTYVRSLENSNNYPCMCYNSVLPHWVYKNIAHWPFRMVGSELLFHDNRILRSLTCICYNVRNNPTLIHLIPLLEIFSFFLICYYTIKTIDDWDWGISNDCWKLVWSYQFQSLLHLIV